MEDQGKRLLLTVGIVAVMYLVWMQFFAPRPQPQPPAPPRAAKVDTPAAQPSAPTPPGAAAAPASAPAPAAASAPAVAACDPAAEASPARWETDDYIATFSRCGAALSSFVLKGAQYKMPAGQLDLVHGTDPGFFPFQIQVDMPPAGSTNPDDKRLPVIPERAEWTPVAATATEVAFRWTSPDGAVQVTKRFQRHVKSRFVLGLDVEVKNTSGQAGDKRVVQPALALFGFQDPNVGERSMFHYAEPTWGTACYVDGKLKQSTAKSLRTETAGFTGQVKWTGLDHQYFLVAAAPLTDATGLECLASMLDRGTLRAELRYGLPSTLEPNQTVHETLAIYAGPKLIDELEGASKIVGADVKLDAAVDLGWFAVLARPMLSLLKLFHGWVGNWGLAIILLTILVKLATLYWTTKSMRSMKAMSRLKPEMDRIKEKFPDDKTRQQQEMMNLYKVHKINPLGGCLPMLLQMPIWFALYRTLYASAEIYRAPFAGWIHDLTAPDPLYILPVSLTALMFVQARITPASVDSQQQKMMQWMMPIMFGVFSLIFPAGLAVYMFTNTLLGMAHQIYMNKTDVAGRPAAAAAAAPPATQVPPSAPKGEGKARKGQKNVAKA
jgi:YidC/Oxa1 family membrane protein insertase